MAMAHMKCLVCSADIYKRRMKYPLCSKECREKNKVKQCERCGKEYKTRGVKSVKRFCSPECGYKSRKKKPVKVHNEPCAFCGNGTGRGLHNSCRNVFCTPKCQANYYYPPKTKLCTVCFGEDGKCVCAKVRKNRDPWGMALRRIASRLNSKSKAAKAVVDEWNVWAKIRQVSVNQRSLEATGLVTAWPEEMSVPGVAWPESAWQAAISDMKIMLKAKVKRSLMDKWDRWAESTASNNRKRRRRKCRRKGLKHRI